MSTPICFFVPGIPAPGGSKKGFAIKKGGVYTGRVIITDAAGQRNKNWRAAVALAAQAQTGEAGVLRGPLRVDFSFVMPRLKAHFHSGKAKFGQLREDAPKWHVSKPDRTKITRSTEDALKGVIYADDSQIVDGQTTKCYGDQSGCLIKITPL